MFEIQIDAKPFEDMVERMGAAMEQMPFALSRALNDAATNAKQVLVNETWPSHVTERNKGFINWALQIERSTKYNLTVAIYDRSEGRGHLMLHAEGGTRTGRGRLAIPTAAVTRGAHGVRANQKPATMTQKVVTPNAIYQRQNRGKKLVKMYTLKATVQQPADVPFEQDFETAMRESVTANFPQRMREAMASAR
jgi:hypothetical protein